MRLTNEPDNRLDTLMQLSDIWYSIFQYECGLTIRRTQARAPGADSSVRRNFNMPPDAR